jgi:hypothetical protein
VTEVGRIRYKLKQRCVKCPHVESLGVLEADPVVTLQLEKLPQVQPGAEPLEQGVVAPGICSILVILLALKWVQCLSW